MAMLSTYAGTKAFINHWSRCLAAEMSPYNIDVLCVRPGLTATRMSGIKTSSFAVADAQVVATKALGMLGFGMLIPLFLLKGGQHYFPVTQGDIEELLKGHEELQ